MFHKTWRVMRRRGKAGKTDERGRRKRKRGVESIVWKTLKVQIKFTRSVRYNFAPTMQKPKTRAEDKVPE